jgi:hypothetical protein
LIYKVRLADGTSTIVHINRLKRVHGRKEDGRASTGKERLNKTAKSDQFRKTVAKEYGDLTETEELDVEVPPNPQTLDIGNESSDEPEEDTNNSPRRAAEDSEWTPGSLCLHRKL